MDGAGPMAVAHCGSRHRAPFRSPRRSPENAETRLSVTATAAAGNGLVGLPAIATVVHDDHLPQLEILEPAGTAYVGTALVARARATDEGSGMATLRLMIDELTQSVVAAGPDGEPLEANAVMNLAAIREGPHTLTAAASDRAGNWATMARLVVVDRTAPDTVILTGPPAEGRFGERQLHVRRVRRAICRSRVFVAARCGAVVALQRRVDRAAYRPGGGRAPLRGRGARPRGECRCHACGAGIHRGRAAGSHRGTGARCRHRDRDNVGPGDD